MKKKLEFSKQLLVQESILIWIITVSYIVLAFMAVITGYIGSLPWLSVIPGLAWGAYAVSQAFYYNKAKAENTSQGIKYETVLAEQQQEQQFYFDEDLINNKGLEKDIDFDYGI